MNFEEIYNAYYKKLYAFAWQHTFSKPDAEDLLHETFLRLWNQIKKEIEILNIQAWLYKVLINLINTRRTTERNHAEKIGFLTQDKVEWKDNHDEYFAQEKKKIIAEELKSLPDKEQHLLLLYHQGLKYEEIARILSINPASIGTVLARTITKFRNKLKLKYHELFE